MLAQRVFTLQSPPRIMRGALRQVLREGLELIRDGPDAQSVQAGWGLFLLGPRMLLYRSRGQTTLPPAELARRVALLG